MNIQIPEKTIFSVSQLNRKAKQLLETHLSMVWIAGEISNLAKPSSGHWYFSLKDSQAQVRCAMFRNTNQRLRWQPQSGDQVLIRARVSLYEGRGEYQLIAEHMEAAGAGLLQQQYEALKDKLYAEGLFDESLKQALPRFPQRIAVITSPTGAAIHDILSVLERRYPCADVIVCPASVQGEMAAAEMVSALHKCHQYSTSMLASSPAPIDVIIIGRGGGSIEDLWAFNDETLARTIAASGIPIVSAVGHEVDFTLADFVADVRAPTPSVSAEIVSPDLHEWQQTLDKLSMQLQRYIQRYLQDQQQSVSKLQQALKHPGERIQQQQQQLSQTQRSLVRSMSYQLERANLQLGQYQQRLTQQHPSKNISTKQVNISNLEQRLHRGIQQLLNKKQQQVQQHAGLLEAVSPLAVLSRGYSVTQQVNSQNPDDQHPIVSSSLSLNIGDEIISTLAEGSVRSVVSRLSHKKPSQ